jgi:hypothetical protein
LISGQLKPRHRPGLFVEYDLPPSTDIDGKGMKFRLVLLVFRPGNSLTKSRQKNSKTTQLDEKVRAANEERQRLRAATRRLKPTFKKPPASR